MFSIESLEITLWGLNVPYTITNGRIFVNGLDITDYSKRELKKLFESVLAGNNI